MNWTAQAALIAMILENGTAEGREEARRELATMGQMLDDCVARETNRNRRREIVRQRDWVAESEKTKGG